MADKDTTPETPEGAPQEAPSDARRSKRAGPTIDLTATEVAPERPSSAQTAPPRPESPPAADDTRQPNETAQAEPTATATRSRGGTGIAAVVGGAAGAVLVLLGLFALQQTGLLPLATAPSADQTAQINADKNAIAALTQRVNAVEEALKKLPTTSDAGLTGRLTAAENAMKSLGVALAALSQRSDTINASANQARARADAAAKAVADLQASVKAAPPAGVSQTDIAALDKRVAALESAAQSARADIGKIATTSSANDHAARLALSAEVLRDAVAVGAPYADELAAVKQLGGDDKALAPLAPFAASGVPSAQALAQQLHALLPAMIKIAGAKAPPGGFLERLEANAGKLVRIRPLNAPAGNEPSAVLARLEIDTVKADIPAALSDLSKLDGATRAPAQAWIATAEARSAALAAARKYAAVTAGALAPKAAAQ